MTSGFELFAFWPITIFAAAVDGYFEAFFMVMAPAGAALGDRA